MATASSILDAGSGIRTLGRRVRRRWTQVDVLLTHLHMDHIQGLPFFAPLHDPDVRVDVWGPVSNGQYLQERLNRYLSPPLFPVRVRDLPNVVFHDVAPGTFEIEGIEVTAEMVSHPGPTLGFRLEEAGGVLHLPARPRAGARGHAISRSGEWTSGYSLALGADVLVHDSQYTDEEYLERVGWGHSSLTATSSVRRLDPGEGLVTFHHDPPTATRCWTRRTSGSWSKPRLRGGPRECPAPRSTSEAPASPPVRRHHPTRPAPVSGGRTARHGSGANPRLRASASVSGPNVCTIRRRTRSSVVGRVERASELILVVAVVDGHGVAETQRAVALEAAQPAHQVRPAAARGSRRTPT